VSIDPAIQRLMWPRTIAVIGASADPRKTTGRPLKYLRKHGFSGTILPVNPNYQSIEDLRCYPSVDALPVAPDAAIVLLDPDRAEAAVRQLSARGAGAAIVLAGGYRETGPDGSARQDRLRAAAGAMRLLGPNTIGLVNVAGSIALSASSALEIDALQQGRIALISQSGGILGSLLSRADYRGLGFSGLVATGNEADLTVSDFIEYFSEDEKTSVIGLYLEGLGDIDHFRRAAAKAAAAGKSLAIFKVGRSAAGALSAASHTGALAGPDDLYTALFAQVGAIRLQSFAELLDIPAALATGRRLRGNRLAILTSTGGAGALLTDACGLAGFATPAPDADTAARIGQHTAGAGAAADRNPIDLTLAGAKPEVFRSVIAALLDSPTYDGVAVVIGSSSLGQPDLVAKPLVESMRLSLKPLIAYVSPSAPHILAGLNRQGVPAFEAPEACAAAFSALARLREASAVVPPPSASQPAHHHPVMPTGALDEAQSKQLFARFGIPSVQEAVARTAEEAQLLAAGFGESLVVKVLAREISHKSDVGGVLVGVPRNEVGERCAKMARDVEHACGLRPEGFVLQERIVGGVEMILGMIRDPQIGPAIMLGAGGIATEVFADKVLRLPPVDRRGALDMLSQLKSRVLLDGFRGQQKADTDALLEAVAAFSRMVAELGPQLLEAEINPLFVLPEGQGVRAADGLAVFG
jgi:acyl-CoA synthetase (NDP forming)